MEKIILPKIIVDSSKKNEERLFWSFLNHPEFPRHRLMILETFPDLKDMFEKYGEKKTTVRKFINQFYSKHKSQISSIVNGDKVHIKNGHKALEKLGEIMEYRWPNNVTYKAVPTILPFSPFGNNVFYFSILDKLMGNGKKRVLLIAIHEISHFVFLDLLRKIERDNKISLPTDAKYYLKETLTAAIFNEEPLKGELKIDTYQGNPDIRDIYIKDSDGNEKKFIDYIRKQYSKNKSVGNKFYVFLTGLVLEVNKSANEFSQKRQIGNRWGKTLFENESELASCRKPIILSAPKDRVS